jgi:AcrR family transcriptional regulator
MAQDLKRQGYHHGELAEAVLDEIERVVALIGAEGVSLRACAKSVGVTHSALFRHFSDKRDVLTAFAIRSAKRMASQIEQKVSQSTPQDAFLTVGLAYINYARLNPGPFRIIFREDIIDPLNQDYRDAMDRLSACLAIGGHGGGNDWALAPKALLAWSSVHGLATLCVDGSLSRDVVEAELEPLLEDTLRQLSPVMAGSLAI